MSENSHSKSAVQLADLTYHLLQRCLEKEYRLAEKYSLTHTEFRCLRFFGVSEVLNNRSIAARMDLSPSRLTRIIDGLVDKGFMSREIDPNDRRNMRVTLTASGIEIVNSLNEAYLNIHNDILNEIDSSQHQQLLDSMTSLLKGIEKWILV